MIIGLIGRTNVGKSTLFNRLVGTYRAIVTDIAGTTRELLREEITFSGMDATMVDSPGLEDFKQEQQFIAQIIEEADILLFVVDGKVALGEQDIIIRDMILQANKKDRTIVLVNKLDGKVYGKQAEMLMADYYSMGFPDLLPVSGKEEEGLAPIGDALRWYVEKNTISLQKHTKEEEKGVHMAIVGRPNVGKSTLLNTLVGDELAWVQDEPGTTLDYITASFTYRNSIVHLYDTAGIRKKGKTVGLEKIAYEKTIKMLAWKKPVAVMLIDIEEGLTHRDKSLIGELLNKGVPMVIAINKIDLYEPDDADQKVAFIRNHIAGSEWIPFVKISGDTGLGLPKLLDAVMRVRKAFTHRVSTGSLNTAYNKAWISSPPRFPKNKMCKCKYITQVKDSPPIFLLSVNNSKYANFAYKRWVEKVIRKMYAFEGVPIELQFSSKVQDNPYLKVNQDKKNKTGEE